jgi:hypothetical protein
MPEAIKIKWNPEIKLPVNSEGGEINDFIMRSIKEGIGDIGDVKTSIMDYRGKPVQTYLMQFVIPEYDLKEFFDMLDIDQVLTDTLAFDDLGLDGLIEPISLGELTSIGDKVEPVEFHIDLNESLDDIIQSIKDEINQTIELIVGIGIGEPIEHDEFETFEVDGFDLIHFSSGYLVVNMRIDGDIAGVDITINNIVLTDDVTEIPGRVGGSTIIRLHTAAPSVDVIFDFAGETLGNELDITIGSMVDNSVARPPDGWPIDLVLESKNLAGYSDPVIRGIEGFDLDIEIDEESYDLGLTDSGFIHGVIGIGTLVLDIDIPDVETPGATWIRFDDQGMEIAIEIFQHPSDSALDPEGIARPGLSWNDGDPDSLVGKNINSNLIINRITVPVGKASFMFSDEDIDDRTIIVKATPLLEIEEFSTLIIDAEKLATAELPEPYTVSLEDLKYLISVDFDEVGVKIPFGEFDLEGFTIMVRIDGLLNTDYDLGNAGYFDIPTSCMEGHGNNCILPECRTIVFHDFNVTLDILEKDNDGNYNLINTELLVEVDILYNGQKFDDLKVLVLTDFRLDKDELKFEIFDPETIFDWSRMVVNLHSDDMPINGMYPELDEAGIDLSSLTEFMEGFIFDGIEAYLYISGPKRFFDLEPEFEIVMFYGDSGHENCQDGHIRPDGTYNCNPSHNLFRYESLMENGRIKNVNAITILDPDDSGIFSGNLPTGGVKLNLKDVINAAPNDLRFMYNPGDELILTPDRLDRKGDTSPEILEMTIVMVLPMDLTAGDNGGKLKLPNSFEGKADFLDRKSPDDPMFIEGLTIKSLNLKIELSHPVFDGGTFFLKKRGEEDGQELLRFPLTGASMSIPVTGKMLEAIENDHQYEIVEVGIRFEPGETLKLPNNLRIGKIEFDVDLEFLINFNGSMGAN